MGNSKQWKGCREKFRPARDNLNGAAAEQARQHDQTKRDCELARSVLAETQSALAQRTAEANALRERAEKAEAEGRSAHARAESEALRSRAERSDTDARERVAAIERSYTDARNDLAGAKAEIAELKAEVKGLRKELARKDKPGSGE